MSKLNGFLRDLSYVDGSAGVNPIGQLSPKSGTYGENISYSDGATPTELLIFLDASGMPSGVTTPMLQSLAGMLGHVYGYNTSQSTVTNDILAVLTTGFSNITLGPLIINPLTLEQDPSSISFTYTFLTISYDFQIWLSDTAFQNECPISTINVATPISNLSLLYTNFGLAKQTIDNLNLLSMSTIISQVQTPVPPTEVYTEYFRVFSSTDNSLWFDFPVAFVCNGGPLNVNPTTCLQAFINLLLSTTSITLDIWEMIIPSLLPTDKFYIIPNWSNKAVTVGGNIGSPTIELFNNPGQNIQTNYFPTLSPDQVNNFLDYTVLQYNSYGLFILPDVENADGRLPFRTKVADYFIVPTNDVLISKMAVNTQEVVNLLVTLLTESITLATAQTSGRRIELLNGHSFLLGVVNSITLSVLIQGT